ncbi:PRK13768 family protein [[Eubacterium] cellulosolvens]
MQIIFVGTAGSGKTSLTNKFGTWIEENTGNPTSFVNLDPGCVNLPYKCDFDIRRYFTIEDIMKKENLGPSGAMLKGAELTENLMSRIVLKIDQLNSQYVLIDTPGQSEIFVFQSAGPAICDHLKKSSQTICVYIIDGLIASSGTNLASAISLSLATQIRLGIPTVNVLNKSDLVKNLEIDRMLSDYDYMKKIIEEEKSGTMKGLALKFLDAAKMLSPSQRLVKVSSITGNGMSQLFDLVQESLCECGDLS